MKFTTFVAIRYLNLSKKNLFFSWIVWLSIIGIAIGVATMIVVLSVINGFEKEIRNRFLAANAHILIYKYPVGISNYKDWIENISKDFSKDITAVSPFIHYESIAKNGLLINSVIIRGIDPKKRQKIHKFSETFITPDEALKILADEIELFNQTSTLPQEPAVIIGKGLSNVLNIKLKDYIKILTLRNNNVSVLKKFKVVGFYDSGLKHYDNKLVIMSLFVAQKFFNMKTNVTGLEIGLKSPWKSPNIASQIENKYALPTKEWQSFNRSLFEALQTERAVIAAIVFLVAIVAGFNILTTSFISVTQKQREISLLKSIGATSTQILNLFIKQSIFIGLLGIILGVFLGFIISLILDKYKFMDLPDPYFLTSLPVEYNISVYLWISILAFIICIIASFYPSLIASKVNPTEGIKKGGILYR